MKKSRPAPTDATLLRTAGGADILNDIIDRMRGGQVPDVDQLIGEYPEYAGDIKQLVAVLEFVHAAADRADPLADLEARMQLSRERPMLGDFRIVREIARGGMGVVYEARQVSLDRRVALKVLLPGATLSPQAVNRFDREAKTAGALHHSNIVPVYAVGEHDGIPYYAMQYIEGVSLSQWIDRKRRANVDASAAHFKWSAEWGRQIADAVAHAHSHGIVHRDIKPSNILIDEQDNIWVTDFGLAKRDAHVTVTMSGDRVGTARYMSPEQARGRPADQRSDVFSLGATLYELIALRPAFDGRDHESALKQVLFDDPIPLRRINRTIPKSLETIIGKSLSKDPKRRYESAAMVRDDLQRFIHGEPLLAHPPSAIDQLRTLVARHKGASAMAALLLLALTSFSIAMTVLYTQSQANLERADRAEKAAEAEAEAATRVSQTLTGLLRGLGPLRSGGPGELSYASFTADEIIDRTLKTMDVELKDQPRARARLLTSLGSLYGSSGRLRDAVDVLTRALEALNDAHAIYSETLGDTHQTTIHAERMLALVSWKHGDYTEAMEHYQHVCDRQLALSGPRSERVLSVQMCMAAIIGEMGRYDESLQALEELHVRMLELTDERGPNVRSWLLGHMADILLDKGELDAAEARNMEALELIDTVFSATHSDRHIALGYRRQNLAKIRLLQDRLDEAESNARLSIDHFRKWGPEDNYHLAQGKSLLAECLLKQSRLDEAEPLLLESTPILERTFGPEHKQTLAAKRTLETLLSLKVIAP